MTGRGDIAGFRLTLRSRAAELGTWTDARGPEGAPAGALLFDERLIADPAARDRLVAAVLTDRDLRQRAIPGLIPTADLVGGGDEVWLLTAQAVNPILAELLAPSGTPAPGVPEAVAVLTDTARTLLALHEAGHTHGAVHPGTVVIGDDGHARLAERGLSDALRGRAASPERDLASWASLARSLAGTWAAGTPKAAQTISAAAGLAPAEGLAEALNVLSDAGRPGRAVLAALARRRTETGSSFAIGGAPADPPTLRREAPDEGEIVTLLGAPAPPGDLGSTQHPYKSGGDDTRGDEVRFGPGVPVPTEAESIWRAGRERLQTVHAQPRHDQRAALWRRGRTIGAAVVFAVIVVAVVLVYLNQGPALAVSAVDIKAPKKVQGCGTTVTISGTIKTNGSSGEVRYEWLRNDRKEPIRQTDTVSSGSTSHEVSLKWTVEGPGDFTGIATLRVLSPIAEGGKVQDKATFTYRC
ncbi:hypothetical protein SAMN05421505_11540 [Sinosporangium album]|uniref:Ig-like domain-containing protein n=1 Tax=Sinosporangium album TaxID=504805 RepID=A0A1G8C453_9ACTN|nr:hypothetical protein [Sinosporangium album]SDH39750.1 hypothetical protein SAMN05421505_11540 [Sinosporangium album]